MQLIQVPTWSFLPPENILFLYTSHFLGRLVPRIRGQLKLLNLDHFGAAACRSIIYARTFYPRFLLSEEESSVWCGFKHKWGKFGEKLWIRSKIAQATVHPCMRRSYFILLIWFINTNRKDGLPKIITTS